MLREGSSTNTPVLQNYISSYKFTKSSIVLTKGTLFYFMDAFQVRLHLVLRVEVLWAQRARERRIFAALVFHVAIQTAFVNVLSTTKRALKVIT